MESLKEKTAKGLFWGGLSNGAQQLLNLVFGVFLARLLSTEDYGMVGMLTIFSLVASSLQEGGFISALNRKPEVSHKDYNAVFWFNIVAGLVIRFFFKKKNFFRFESFDEPKNRDTDPNIFKRLLKNLYRNLRATGLYLLIGILLSAIFQRYVPAEAVTFMFGGNEAWGVLMAATVGVPLYACGGGTIPLLNEWLREGMSIGSAAAFMLTGPATKITNLGALKIVLGTRRFLLYLAFVMAFALLTGIIANLVL